MEPLYISENETLHFPARAENKQKNSTRKKFLIFPEMEFSSSNMKKILILPTSILKIFP